MSLVLIPILIRAVRANGETVAGARVRARLTVEERDDGVVVPLGVDGETDANGECIVNLWPNSRGVNGSQYRIVIDGGETSYFSGLITVPEASSSAWPVSMDLLINQAPYPSKSVAEAAQLAAAASAVEAAGLKAEAEAARDETVQRSEQVVSAAETVTQNVELIQTAAAQTSLSAADAAAAAEEARATANATGPIDIQATYADALAQLPTYAENAIVEVISDEQTDGARTRYRVESGVLVFKVNMDQWRITLAAGDGAGRVGVRIPNFDITTVYDWLLSGAIPLTAFGADPNGTDSTTAMQDAIDYCLRNRKVLCIPPGNFKFSPLEFDAADYEAAGLSEKGFVIKGAHRIASRLNGSLTFHGADGGTYSNRFVGLSFQDLSLWNDDGDALTLSGYGKVYVDNCLIRGQGGIGLSLLGGSEFGAWNSEFAGSLVNVKVRSTDKDDTSVDAAVINFYECNIANSVSDDDPAEKNIDVVGNGRSINFFGGNLISSQSPSYFENAQVGFDSVDFENTFPVYFDTCQIVAMKCLFAEARFPKIVLTSSKFIDDSNLWDASVNQDIQVTDTASVVVLQTTRGSVPTIRLTHTTHTPGQVTYPFKESRFPNFDLSKDFYQPYNPSAMVHLISSTYVTGGYALQAEASGTYIQLPLNKALTTQNIASIAAIEFIASSGDLMLVDSSGAPTAVGGHGLLFQLQEYSNGLKRYVWIPKSDLEVTEIRYVFQSASYIFDSAAIYGGEVSRVISRTSTPTTGKWRRGDIVYNSEPATGGYIGWICTVAGTPGTWRAFGAISS